MIAVEFNMSRPIRNIPGAWPEEMRAETAAAYCDEPSVESFLSKVAKGIYSQPNRAQHCAQKWHRKKLDRDIARRHGIEVAGPPLIDDASELI